MALKTRLFVTVTTVLLMLACSTAVARGGPDGNIPFPGLCDYPGTGSAGLDGVSVYHYWCDFPMEINGAHWHCQYGGAASEGTVGFSMMFNASITSQVGVLQGTCSWRCPNMDLADAPNPPGQWKTYIKPTSCHSIAPNPDLPPPPKPPETPGAPNAPPGETPNTEQNPQPVPDHTPAVTNPDQPNPEATNNPPT